MNFWIQAGNPRSLHVLDDDDQSVSEALQTVFPLWTEEAFMVWDRIHIPLNYKYIISFMIADVLNMIEMLTRHNSGQLTINWPSNDFAAIWQMSWNDTSTLHIQAKWSSVVGFTESLLCARPRLITDKRDFISEWKQVLGIALKALTEAGYGETRLADMARLRKIHDEISEPGILYRQQ